MKPLWKCPRCGHRFVTKNLWHSCGRYRLADHFAGKDPILRSVYRRWVAAARGCGRITVYAQKTRIVFQRRVRFGGAVVRKRSIEGALWLRRRIDHPTLLRVESFGALGWGHTFHLKHPDDIDAKLETLMAEAYEVGRGAS